MPSRRILLGTSYGALMAVVHADLYPDRVASIVLVDRGNHPLAGGLTA